MNSSLLTEAVVVGVGLVPVYALSSVWTRIMFKNMDTRTQDYVAVFFAGGMFHLICEGSGINEWYLVNGYAVHKRMKHEDVDWSGNDHVLCQGQCGWKNDGMCAHQSYHE